MLLFMNWRVVESVGENVNEVAEGDTVLPIFMPDCGQCTDCRSEKSNLCSKFPFKVSPWMPRYESSRFTDLKGEVLYHFLFVSSFSEYTVVDIANITKIDPAIPPNRACLFSCGVSTGKKVFDFVFFGWHYVTSYERNVSQQLCSTVCMTTFCLFLILPFNLIGIVSAYNCLNLWINLWFKIVHEPQ